ncbi:MAG: bifunctional phosphoglucose/phosphomannose isomerase, partial [Solirubrobacteraceae bacterium]|nr:bifunctional phosphoglucose/phosphomannose isomerase [Solirubrobacteraceae bacterium]
MAQPADVIALDPETVAAGDPSEMFTDALSLPDQLRDAAWKVESAGLTPWESPDGLVIAGMGGSGIGGALAVAAIGDQATRPITLARGYELPSWTTKDTTVLCTSYSGDTEETLACYDAAGVIGARRVVATTGGQLGALARQDGVPVIPIAGGLQPRAALGYVFTAGVEVAALAGVAPRRTTELDVAAAHLEELVREWGPSGPDDSEPKELARALHGTIPLLYGAGPTRAVAYRWKCQINENAKLHAFSHHLPELDHNELMGWELASDSAPFSAVFLDDTDLHPRIAQRIAVTRRLIEEQAARTVVIPPRAGTPIERLLSLSLLGDLASIYLAILRGVDPSPIAGLDKLKAALAE